MYIRLLFALSFLPLAAGQPLSGVWDASVKVNGLDVPFRMEISSKGTNVAGSFLNGEEKLTSTSGSFTGSRLLLLFDYYGATLDATYSGGQLTGTYSRGPRGAFPFQAKKFTPSEADAANVPSIDGIWEMSVDSAKGEGTWRLIVRQSGPEVSAAILRIDGDTGTLSGTWSRGRFVLSHFSGARPTLVEVTPLDDGTLEIHQNGKNRMIARRSSEARSKGLPEPADPSRFTSLKNPAEPFHFRFPDLNGKMVSDADPRFQGKVMIVSITGSWCPNCHDEAPFLAELYSKYKAIGLEIVGLFFEEPEQLKNPERVRAFLRKYNLGYTALLAGEQADAAAKLPQLANFAAFPTAIFIGRDGRVRKVHTGFASVATGDLHRQLKAETAALVERLLAENAVTQR